MHADVIKTIIEQAKDHGARVAVGFADRSFFVKDITAVETAPAGDDTLFTVTGQVYDTGHSRDYTPEAIYFQASDVISLARPAAL